VRLTESKLRQIIRDILWEAGDPDSDADDAAELRDVAADLEKKRKANVAGSVERERQAMALARSGKAGEEQLGSAQAVDLADKQAIEAGIPSFIDWAQEVADLVQSINGIEEIPDSDVYGVPYDAWSMRIAGGHVPAAEYASTVSGVAAPALHWSADAEMTSELPGKPGSRQHYKAWAEETGQITMGASSVLATYMIDQGMEDNKRLLQHLATQLGIDPMDARRELQSQRAEAEADLGRSEQDRYMAGFMSEIGIIPGGKMNNLMRKMLSEARFDWSPETGAVPREGVPWEFGPEGYASRPHFQQKMKGLGIAPHTDKITMIKVALSNRAEELTMGPDGEYTPYLHTVDPEHFSKLAARLFMTHVMRREIDLEGIDIDLSSPEGKKRRQELRPAFFEDLIMRIDAGEAGVPGAYFDEEIDDVQGWRGDTGAPPEGQGETLGDVESGFDIPAPDESNFPLAPPEGSLTESRLMQLAGILEG